MGMRGTAPPVQPGSDTMRGAILLATGAGLAIVLALPPPPGLSAAGRAALAVVPVAVVLWSTEALPTGAPAVGAILLLALTGAVPALLTGGVTPVVAAALMGGFTWTSWLLFMGVPVYTLLALGGLAVYLLTRPDREGLVESDWKLPREPLHGRERRALAIAAVVSALWMT